MSEYGVDYMSESPVKLLELLMHGERKNPDQQVKLKVLPCMQSKMHLHSNREQADIEAYPSLSISNF